MRRFPRVGSVRFARFDAGFGRRGELWRRRLREEEEGSLGMGVCLTVCEPSLKSAHRARERRE